MTASGSALVPEFTDALANLSISVSNAVDLAIALAQRIGGHIASLRSSKQPLRLADIEVFLDEVTAESANANEAPPWDLIGAFVQRLGLEVGGILPKAKNASKSNQVVSRECQPDSRSRWLS